MENYSGWGSNDAGGCLVSLIATFLYYFGQQGLKYNLLIAATAEEEISGKERDRKRYYLSWAK